MADDSLLAEESFVAETIPVLQLAPSYQTWANLYDNGLLPAFKVFLSEIESVKFEYKGDSDCHPDKGGLSQVMIQRISPFLLPLNKGTPMLKCGIVFGHILWELN